MTVILAALLAAPAAEPTAVRKADVTYATVGGQKLQLDFVAPKGAGPHPCVVCLHGGAWKAGSRKDLSRPAIPWVDFAGGGGSFLDVLAAKGFAAASVSYRLAPAAKFPAQIQDAKAAVKYLRAHAAELNIDPARIAALGFSAGGHLANLLGTASDVPAFDSDLFPGVSGRVRCVVNFFGPADLTLYCETPGIEASFMVPLLGCKSCDDMAPYKLASPVEHVTADDPPFLHVHGTADIIVPLVHSKRLHAKLVAAGVPSELVAASGKGHGWGGPAAAAATEKAVRFLADHLAKAK